MKTRVKKTPNPPIPTFVNLVSEEDESDIELPILYLEEDVSLINSREIRDEKENDGDGDLREGGEEGNVSNDGDGCDGNFVEELMDVSFWEDAQRLTDSWYTTQPVVEGEGGCSTTATTTTTTTTTTPTIISLDTGGAGVDGVGSSVCSCGGVNTSCTTKCTTFDEETDILMSHLYEDPDDFLFIL